MAPIIRTLAFGLIAAAAMPAAATDRPTLSGPSPSDGADVEYCLRIERITGSRLELVRCWTRAQWAEQGVDVDKEWPKEGVAVRR